MSFVCNSPFSDGKYATLLYTLRVCITHKHPYPYIIYVQTFVNSHTKRKNGMHLCVRLKGTRNIDPSIFYFLFLSPHLIFVIRSIASPKKSRKKIEHRLCSCWSFFFTFCHCQLSHLTHNDIIAHNNWGCVASHRIMLSCNICRFYCFSIWFSFNAEKKRSIVAMTHNEWIHR